MNPKLMKTSIYKTITSVTTLESEIPSLWGSKKIKLQRDNRPEAVTSYN